MPTPTTNRAAADLEDALAAEQVAELPGQDGRDRLREQVGGNDPRQVTGPAESPTIVGSAVATIVWSRAASSIPARIVAKIRFILRRSSSSVSRRAGSPRVASTVNMGTPRSGSAVPRRSCPRPTRRFGRLFIHGYALCASGDNGNPDNEA